MCKEKYQVNCEIKLLGFLKKTLYDYPIILALPCLGWAGPTLDTLIKDDQNVQWNAGKSGQRFERGGYL